MEQNEPSTGEIVFALRCCGNCENCDAGCYYMGKDCGNVLLNAADRLESQEREIERLIDALKFYKKEEVINANR